jgi:hypothetical protein
LQFSPADIAAILTATGESVTLIPDASNEVIGSELTITALYQIEQEHLLPLDGTRQGEMWTAICSESTVTGSDTWCQLRARGMLHNVLSIVPDGSGFVHILLSDPWVEA